jgi:hypothetical protein
MVTDHTGLYYQLVEQAWAALLCLMLLLLRSAWTPG